jgi:dTMP kinase
VTSGKFITLEGGEGAGKSTQALMLANALEERGVATVVSREPGGTPGAEAIRALLLDNAGQEWGLRAEALLFAAARADHVERLIRPALEAGKWVICDRFLDSSRAYQGEREGLSDAEVMDLHRIGSDSLLPDLTVLIEVDPVEAGRRTAARDSGQADRIAGRDAAYHALVANRFRDMAWAEPERFIAIDGNGPPDEVAARVREAIWQKFALC